MNRTVRSQNMDRTLSNSRSSRRAANRRRSGRARNKIARSSKPLKFLQLNCGKRITAAAFINQRCDKEDLFIGLLQEPKNSFANPSNLDNQHKIISARDSNPRAALYLHRDLSVWKLERYCEKDMSCALVYGTRTPRVVISIYWDSLINHLPQKLDQVIRFAKDNNYDVVLGGDLNAHSEAFGSTYTDNRGTILEDFVATNNLTPLNRGSNPTFDSHLGSSVIDFTFVSQGLADEANDWEVRDENDNTSDHKLITFTLDHNKVKYKMKRSFKSINWDDFNHMVDNRLRSKDPKGLITIGDIEAATNEVITTINEVLDILAPFKRVRIRPSIKTWWNCELDRLKERVQECFDEYKINSNRQNSQLYRTATREYKSAMQKAKRTSWYKFQEEVKSLRDIARLNNVIKRLPRTEVGLLKNTNGEYTNTPEESVDLLMNKCFPGCTAIPEGDILIKEYPQGYKTIIEHFNHDWITDDKVAEAFGGFNSTKTPGPDNLRPDILKNIPGCMVSRFTEIFSAMISTGYTPKAWRKSKVVFIPKPGKDSYDLPNSFRPISLTSFAFKALERLSIWEMGETALRNSPFHKDQHAFRAGFSTETAISETVHKLEQVVLNGKFALGVFLDVKSAFDYLQPNSIIQAMERRGINPLTIKWYGNYLTSRICEVEVNGITLQKALKLGSPQGGLKSVIAWALVFDELLENLEANGIDVTGYADDAFPFVRGTDLISMFAKAQLAIDIATAWATRHGLELAPNKTVVVLFTRKQPKSYIVPSNLSVYGKEIPLSTEATYLGLTLDSKLNWGPHIQKKIAQAKKNLFRLRNAINRLYGPKPEAMLWAYTAIIRPQILYGCYVWGHKCQTRFQKQLKSIQRLALLMTGHYRKGTPGDGLDVITGTLPLRLEIRATSMKSFIRLRDRNVRQLSEWDGKTTKNLLQNGHLYHIVKYFENGEVDLYEQYDTIPKFRVKEKNFKTSINDGEDSINNLTAYTDGSRFNDMAGAGVAIYTPEGDEILQSLHLGPFATVFQAEVIAIQRAAEIIAGMATEAWAGETLLIRSDSQAAIQALSSRMVKSRTVKNALDSLSKIPDFISVEIRWIKAHVGHLGNEEADRLAKEGAEDIGAEYFEPEFPQCAANAAIRKALEREYNIYWHNSSTCRQTKIFFPDFNSQKAKKLIKGQDRVMFSRLVRFITGHAFLRRHNTVCETYDPPSTLCRLCEDGSEETPEHLITFCPVLWRSRMQELGNTVLNPFRPEWTPSGLVGFLRNPIFATLEEPEPVE